MDKKKYFLKWAHITLAVFLFVFGATTVFAQSADENAAAQWPDNEWTRQLPKPVIPFSVFGDDKMWGRKVFRIDLPGAALAQAKDYVAQLKQADFTGDVSEVSIFGGWRFTAKNAAGYYVMAAYTKKQSAIVIGKE